METLAYEALRKVQRELAGADGKGPVSLRVHPEVAGYLQEREARSLEALSQMVGRVVEGEAAPELARGDTEVGSGG